jgi:ligand-binding SRPBCC domain-containing protein
MLSSLLRRAEQVGYTGEEPNMETFVLQREQRIPQPVEEVFAFFGDARNLEAVTPAWLSFRILSPEPIAMRPGTHILYRLRWHGIPLRWVTEIQEWHAPIEFIDVQAQGPYWLWHHTHRFQPIPGGTLMRDVVRYVLPLGLLGRVVHAWLVKADLEAIFDYRAVKVSDLWGAWCASA